MITKSMLSETGMMPKKTANPRKNTKKKLKGSKLKAGVSLDKVVKNVQQIFEEKKAGTTVVKRRSGKRKRLNPKKLQRGIVYIGHIPHGFYEEQMKEYFKQFGSVTRVRVSRSKNTGKSRGYGYVEFVHTEVAKIAAETMNNYLMCGRLLKATYIPPEKQHQGFFGGKDWTEEMYPRLQERQKTIRMKNAVQSAEDYQRYVKKSCNKLSSLQEKLKAKGISMQFQPVDVPET